MLPLQAERAAHDEVNAQYKKDHDDCTAKHGPVVSGLRGFTAANSVLNQLVRFLGDKDIRKIDGDLLENTSSFVSAVLMGGVKLSFQQSIVSCLQVAPFSTSPYTRSGSARIRLRVDLT